MFNADHLDQVRLLLRCLPEVAHQTCFALKGGTAINLFVRDMPRISVDIDLAYLPLKERTEALTEIGDALDAIYSDIMKHVDGCAVRITEMEGHAAKLHVTRGDAMVSIEPNLVWRGSLYIPETRELTPSAQEQFESYVSIPVQAKPDLYGGKLCAALDRQHPRDLYDAKLLLDERGLTRKVIRAFVVYLAGHPRPMNELLNPVVQDISALYRDQFEGMTRDPTALDELIAVQYKLAGEIRNALNEDEKAFLLSIKKGEPEWGRLGIADLDKFPALRWKVLNVKKMDKGKRMAALDNLTRILFQ